MVTPAALHAAPPPTIAPMERIGERSLPEFLTARRLAGNRGAKEHDLKENG